MPILAKVRETHQFFQINFESSRTHVTECPSVDGIAWATPDLVGDAFEEMVRHQGVLQSVGRTALAACEVGGRRIERGQRLFLLLQSANRDEREFESPERFDIRRRPRRHLGFGHGPHHCPGIHMARLEGRVLVEELLARIPEWQVDEAACERPPSDFQLGYVSLPIVF